MKGRGERERDVTERGGQREKEKEEEEEEDVSAKRRRRRKSRRIACVRASRAGETT